MWSLRCIQWMYIISVDLWIYIYIYKSVCWKKYALFSFLSHARGWEAFSLLLWCHIMMHGLHPVGLILAHGVPHVAMKIKSLFNVFIFHCYGPTFFFVWTSSSSLCAIHATTPFHTHGPFSPPHRPCPLFRLPPSPSAASYSLFQNVSALQPLTAFSCVQLSALMDTFSCNVFCQTRAVLVYAKTAIALLFVWAFFYR